MRKIEKQMLQALMERKNMHISNTEVQCHTVPHPFDKEDTILDHCDVYLFGNLIATVHPDSVTVTNCGYRTATTKSRLHVILREFCGACLSQNNFEWYITTPDDVIPMQDRVNYTIKRVPLF